MRAGSLIVLLLSLGVAAGVAALVVHWKGQGPTRAVLGSSLMAHLSVNELASVTIKSASDSVSLVKQKGGWVVRERFNYPADFSKIADLVLKLREAKVGMQFEGSEEILNRLALKDPDAPQASEAEKGTRVVLKDQGEKVLARVLLGSFRQAGPESRAPAGRYLRLGESNTVYLVDEQFHGGQGDPAAWFDRELVKATPTEVKRISCTSADGKRSLYTFERSGPGKELELVNLLSSSRVKDYELRRLAAGLRSLLARDVVERATAPAADGLPWRIDYQLFDGTIYRVYFSSGCSEATQDQCFLRLEVSYEERTADKDDDRAKQGDAAEKTEKTPAELAGKAKRLNERLSPWIYLVPWSQHYAFKPDLSWLLEAEKKKGRK